jgi:hypothetical protein
LNIHEVVRATTTLEDVLSKYVPNPAIRLMVIADYQCELIQRELNRPVDLKAALSQTVA